MALSPPPSSVPLLDNNGTLSIVWEQWFQSIYNNNNLETVIKTIDLDSTSSVIFDINSIYKAYKIEFDKVAISTSAGELLLYGSSNSGSTYGSSNLLYRVDGISTSFIPINGYIVLKNALTSTYSTVVSWNLEYGISGDFVTNIAEQEYTTTTTLNNIKLELSQGTFSSGRIRLIGLKQ